MKHIVTSIKQRLAGSRTRYYLLAFAVLLAPGVVLGGLTACSLQGCTVVNIAKSCAPAILSSSGVGDLPSRLSAHVTSDNRLAAVWVELGMTGVITPTTTAQGLFLSPSLGQAVSMLDELAEKAYLAIRVPHAPPAYTASNLIPGLPPEEPDALIFSYYAPPKATELTTVPVSITRRTEYEAVVNARFPITDNRSHWEVWWLPEGEEIPIPAQPFRLDKESWPPPLAIRFRVDFVDAAAEACSGCPVQVLFYSGYAFIGPYEFSLRYTDSTAYPEPLVTFGGHCVYKRASLATTIGQVVTATVPFTHVHCLENWDRVARTFTVTATSSQGWEYAYYYQTTEAGSVPVAVPGMPFTVTVGAPPDEWSPGLLGILAVHTPSIGTDDALRETFHITATSVISPNVWAHMVSFALTPGYRLDEGEAGFAVYLPLVMSEFP